MIVGSKSPDVTSLMATLQDHFGLETFLAQNTCDFGQRTAVGYVQRVEPHVGHFQLVGLWIEGHAVVHRRVVQPRLEQCRLKIVERAVHQLRLVVRTPGQ